ncbi:MAG: signal peptidase I [Ruminiclostridium sp.]|nr:signal peptidase I [Ruminiclostridium sp.]
MEEKSLNEEKVPAEKKSDFFYMEFYDWIAFIFSAMLCFIFVFTVVVRPINVDGDSMYPTLKHKDMLAVSDIGYEPQYEDIVVVYAPRLYNSITKTYGKAVVKRVIGLPGDTIRIDFGKGVVYRNGVALDEPYINTLTTVQENFPNNKEVKVPENRLFVLGDNRNISKDSRSYDIGMIDTRYVIGKTLFRVLPVTQFGPVR